VKVYQVLLIYQYLSLSGYQVLLLQSQEAYQVLEFLEMFLIHDPAQPNPTRRSTQPMDNSAMNWLRPTMSYDRLSPMAIVIRQH